MLYAHYRYKYMRIHIHMYHIQWISSANKRQGQNVCCFSGRILLMWQQPCASYEDKVVAVVANYFSCESPQSLTSKHPEARERGICRREIIDNITKNLHDEANPNAELLWMSHDASAQTWSKRVWWKGARKHSMLHRSFFQSQVPHTLATVVWESRANYSQHKHTPTHAHTRTHWSMLQEWPLLAKSVLGALGNSRVATREDRIE